MTDSYKVLMVASECVPFAKSGGLGDVVGVLPRFLKKAGHEVTIVIPLYSFIDRAKYNIEPVIDKMVVPLGGGELTCSVHRTTLPENIPVYFIDQEIFFARPNMYHDNYFNDYQDNPTRFIFLSKAALQLCHELDYSPDIVHANDWHTAVLPALLKRHHSNDPLFSETASVLTIHNIAYQGRYHRNFFHETGLDWSDFTSDKFECHHAINLLKGGIQFADMINTVSRGYAEETRYEPGGHGLSLFLKKRGQDYVGILNGVDYTQWNPETDPMIPENYSRDDLGGKTACKIFLKKKMELVVSDDTPVIGIVSRLVDQKGFHLLAECIEGILNNMDVQFAILGAGDKHLEQFFSSMMTRHPGRVGTYIGYSNELAHQIEAGSDMFLMPSIYEPCGLNQIYSLKYGTIPVVRATGGLNDTIENYDQDTGEGTGFKFREPSGSAVYNTIKWSVDTYHYRKNDFRKLIRRAMEQNFPWENSAAEYVRLYERAKARVMESSPVFA
jgi:starch synthase